MKKILATLALFAALSINVYAGDINGSGPVVNPPPPPPPPPPAIVQIVTTILGLAF